MVPGLRIPCHQMCVDDVIALEVGSAGSVVKASFLPSTPATLLVKTFSAVSRGKKAGILCVPARRGYLSWGCPGKWEWVIPSRF